MMQDKEEGVEVEAVEEAPKKPSSKRSSGTKKKKSSSKKSVTKEDRSSNEEVEEGSTPENSGSTKKKKKSKKKMTETEEGREEETSSKKAKRSSKKKEKKSMNDNPPEEDNHPSLSPSSPKKSNSKKSLKKTKSKRMAAMAADNEPSVSKNNEDPTETEVDDSNMYGESLLGKDSSKKEDKDIVEPNLKVTSWFNQFFYVSKKNVLLLSRRPLMITVYLLSSVVSVIIAWVVGKDNEDAIYEDFDDCGTVPYPIIEEKYSNDYEKRDLVQFSLNEEWRNGVAIALMTLGAMFNAIIVLLVLHGEISTQLLGMLRALGVRDSVYWVSWYIPFLILSFINAFLGAITAQTLPNCHAFDSIYFGGIFGSLLFVQLPLIASSFFIAAVLGTAKRGLSWMILLMIVAAWVPCIVMLTQSENWLSHDRSFEYSTGYASGVFWQYQNTYKYDRQYNDTLIGQLNVYDYCEDVVGEFNWTNIEFQDCIDENYQSFEDERNENSWWTTCNLPIVSEEQGKWFKTVEERAQMTDDEYFVGCYSKASWPTEKWSAKQQSLKQFALTLLYFFPYFHFTSVWGNFLGYTQMPDREFTRSVANLSPEELAIEALPSPPDPSTGLSSGLFPQGSTVIREVEYREGDYWNVPIDRLKSTCPLPNQTESNICGDLGSGYQTCSYADEPVPTESKSVGQVYWHMVLLSIMYLFMAAYWAQVFPGGNGKRQPYHFFVLPRYWFGAKLSKQQQSTAEDGDQEANPRLSSDDSGVVVDSIRKLYGSFEAVKGVSLKMARSEVTALLGHNGAGKTTLSHILCCETAPSEGDAYIYGYSVTQDSYTVRNLVGLCKQDDYLWQDLTAKEHLELYAGLRGVERSKIQDTVLKWLESVDLAEVQLQYSGGFSGGMKRRLSVALATIGERPLIILDEPTTGMDPVSRRFVWRHIDEIKQNRVILLTTHAMEEADLLADEVAIMRKGELAAFGTPLELKAEHGSALQFSLLVPKTEVSEARKMILDFFASSMDWVDFDFGEAGNMTVNIRRIKQGKQTEGVEVKLLSEFVAWLEGTKSPVTEYGFSNSSLEEVFLKVTDAEDETDEEENQDNRRNCCRSCFTCKCCCSRSKTPEEIDNERKAEEEVIAASNEHVDDKSRFEGLSTFHPELSVRNQVPALVIDFFTRSWTGRASIFNYIIYGLLLIGNIILGLAMANASNPSAGFAMPVTTLSLLLISVIGPIYADRSEGLLYLMRTQGLIAESYLASTGLYGFLIQLLYAFLVLTALYATPIFRSPYVCDGYDDEACYWENVKWSDRQHTEAETIYNFEDEFMNTTVTLQAVREPGGYGLIIGAILCFALTYPGAVWSSSYLPGYKFPLVVISIVVLFVGILPMAQLFGFSDQEKYMQCLNVIDPNNVCGETFNITQVNDEFVNCVAYQVNEAMLPSFCLAPHAALLPQYGLFQMLTMTYTRSIRFLSDPPEYVEEVLIPALDDYVKCSGDACKVPQAGKVYGLNLLFMLIGAVILIVLGVMISASLGFPIGPVLQLRKWMARMVGRLRFGKNDKRINQENHHVDGEKDSTENELPEVAEEREEVQAILQPFLNLTDEDSNGGSDQPLRLNHSSISRDTVPPVVGSGLRKVYPSRGGQPPKVALKSLDLHVPKGQVLGFLGKNGAGKTTALKILAGAHDASDGIGLVAGYDCATERIQVFERLGNCPQFDVVWKTRTVQNHLEFLARLKGLPRTSVTDVAHSIAMAVGLGSDAFYHRKAGELSGGMRRRLSIAMSLIGSPAVVILDEPTTGLDPSTRSSIWGLINSFATENRSMIITTHMMIEADTLCNRIAIITQGELKVVGTQQHLKNEFGLGYLLQLNLTKSTRKSQNKAMSFVKKHLHPKAVLGTKQAKTLHINLPREGLDLQKVFSALYSPEASKKGCINQFLLSQSSLEDVFVALGD